MITEEYAESFSLKVAGELFFKPRDEELSFRTTLPGIPRSPNSENRPNVTKCLYDLVHKSQNIHLHRNLMPFGVT